MLDPRAIHIYTDGSCYKNPGGDSGCAAIVHFPEHLGKNCRPPPDSRSPQWIGPDKRDYRQLEIWISHIPRRRLLGTWPGTKSPAQFHTTKQSRLRFRDLPWKGPHTTVRARSREENDAVLQSLGRRSSGNLQTLLDRDLQGMHQGLGTWDCVKSSMHERGSVPLRGHK